MYWNNRSLSSAPAIPIQFCAGCDGETREAVLKDGSSGLYEASARNRRIAATNRRNPTSSFNRLLPVGVNSREKKFIMARGQTAVIPPHPEPEPRVRK